jgi:hypothetical protein
MDSSGVWVSVQVKRKGVRPGRRVARRFWPKRFVVQSVGGAAVGLDGDEVGGPAQVDAVAAGVHRVPDGPLEEGRGKAAVQADEADAGFQG